MKKIIPRLLNYILYAIGVLIAGSGFLIKWKIPHGPGGRDTSLWGLDRHDWREFHLWGGMIIVLLVVWHLWLHRRWIMNVACQKHSISLLASLLAPVILIGALALTPLRMVTDAEGKCGGENREQCKAKQHQRTETSAGRPGGCGEKGKSDGCQSRECSKSRENQSVEEH